MLNVIVRLVVIEKNYDFNNTTDSDMDINRLAIALLYGNEMVEVVEIDQSNKQIKLRFFGSESKLDRIVKKTVNNTKQNIIGNKKTQIYEHSSKGRKDNISSWTELIRLGYVHEYDKGHCGYTGFFLEVVKELDSLFVQIAKRMNVSKSMVQFYLKTGMTKIKSSSAYLLLKEYYYKDYISPSYPKNGKILSKKTAKRLVK